MMFFNQKCWNKLSGKEWLVNSDRNSKYLQHNADTRRKRKIVVKLKDECSIWIDNHKATVDKFILDYSKRFKSTQTIAEIYLI